MHCPFLRITERWAKNSNTGQIGVRHRTARNIVRVLVGNWPDSRDLINPQVKMHARQKR